MDNHLKAQRTTILTPPLAPSRAIRQVVARPGEAARRWLAAHWEWLLIGVILLIAGLAHGINMFNYPFFYDDEGTYMAQAWAILHQGQLAPYTYWYDHAPAGWIQIALWELLTGGSHTFGGAIRSGRVLMLLIHLGSVYLVYRIARDASGKVLPAVLAALLFTLSPYELFYGRMVMLDNICAFWLLLSISVLLSARPSLSRVWMSAVALAISILSKELTVFLLPAMAYLVYWRMSHQRRAIAVAEWVTLVVSICSLYMLMAAVKGELFPTGTVLGGIAPHVSLLGSLAYQASRGKDGGIFQASSGFWQIAHRWIHDEPLLVIGGTISTVIITLVIKPRRLYGFLGMISFSLWVFLARGGGDIVFYIVPLLPVLALNLSLALDVAGEVLQKLVWSIDSSSARRLRVAVYLAAILMCIVGAASSIHTLYSTPQEPLLIWTNRQAVVQREAAAWISANVPVQDSLVVDMPMWTALHESRPSILVFDHADYYWKVEEDPAIRQNVYHGNWRDLDYVVITNQMLMDMSGNQMTILQDALAHCTVVARFDTGGWPITICKVNNGRQDGAIGPRVRIASQAARDRRPPALVPFRLVAV